MSPFDKDEEGVIMPDALFQQRLSKKHKGLIRQFKHSLTSPKRFHQFLDSLESWLTSRKDSHQIKHFLKAAYSFYRESSKEARPSLTEFLQSSIMLLLVSNPEHHDQPNPEKPRKRRGVVYEREQRQYTREQLPATPENIIRLLDHAYREPEHSLNRAALQVLGKFAETAAKTEGTSLSKAARDHNIPINTLSRWVIDGLVPFLYRDKKTTYIANETAEELARLKQEASEMGVQPGKLLRERRNQQDMPLPSLDHKF